jgi:hypothetical protein
VALTMGLGNYNLQNYLHISEGKLVTVIYLHALREDLI